MASFLILFSHDSCFLIFLCESVITQSTSLWGCQLRYFLLFSIYKNYFLLPCFLSFFFFLNPDCSINPFYCRAHTQWIWHVQEGGKMAWGWKRGNEHEQKVLPQKDLASLKIISTETWHLTRALLWGGMCLTCDYERGHCAFIFLFWQRILFLLLFQNED